MLRLAGVGVTELLTWELDFWVTEGVDMATMVVEGFSSLSMTFLRLRTMEVGSPTTDVGEVVLTTLEEEEEAEAEVETTGAVVASSTREVVVASAPFVAAWLSLLLLLLSLMDVAVLSLSLSLSHIGEGEGVGVGATSGIPFTTAAYERALVVTSVRRARVVVLEVELVGRMMPP